MSSHFLKNLLHHPPSLQFQPNLRFAAQGLACHIRLARASTIHLHGPPTSAALLLTPPATLTSNPISNLRPQPQLHIQHHELCASSDSKLNLVFLPFPHPPPYALSLCRVAPLACVFFSGGNPCKKILGGVEPTPFVCDRAGSMGLGLASRLCVGRSSSALSYTQDLISNSNTKFSLSSLPTALDLFRVAPLANFFKLRGNPCKIFFGGALSFNPTHLPPNTSLATLLPHPDPSPSHPPFPFKLRLSPCPAPTLPNISLSLVRFPFLLPPLLRHQYLSTLSSHSQPNYNSSPSLKTKPWVDWDPRAEEFRNIF